MVDLHSVNLIPPKRSSLEMRVDGRFYQTRSRNLGIHLHPKIKMSGCEKTVNFVMKAFLDSPLAFEPSYILAVGLIYLETRVASRPEPTL